MPTIALFCTTFLSFSPEKNLVAVEKRASCIMRLQPSVNNVWMLLSMRLADDFFATIEACDEHPLHEFYLFNVNSQDSRPHTMAEAKTQAVNLYFRFTLLHRYQNFSHFLFEIFIQCLIFTFVEFIVLTKYSIVEIF